MRTSWACLLLLCSACGSKPAKPAGDPADAPNSTNDEVPKWESGSAKPETPPAKFGGIAPVEGQRQRSDSYDKEQTEIVLKRAARQVKDNCGATKDDTGKASGPWGKVVVQVALAHNGHGQLASIPEPYKGKATGNCVERAFSKLTFPPWAGADTTLDWEIELVQPAVAAPPTKK